MGNWKWNKGICCQKCSQNFKVIKEICEKDLTVDRFASVVKSESLPKVGPAGV
ncbi:MAG: hypothetical protein ABII27_05830 [bacterium]